jgi:hypothetical protein
MTLRKARNASRGYSILIEWRRKEELPAVVPDHRLNRGHLYSIVQDLHTKGCTFGATENVPCRLLLFYCQPSPDNDLSNRDSSECANDECRIRALVQTCSYRQALGTPEEHKEKLYDTNLLSRHALAATRVASSIRSPAHNLPRTDSVPVKSIQDNLIVVEEMPGLCKSWHGTRYVWLAKNRKLEWPSMFHIGA